MVRQEQKYSTCTTIHISYSAKAFACGFVKRPSFSLHKGINYLRESVYKFKILPKHFTMFFYVHGTKMRNRCLPQMVR